MRILCKEPQRRGSCPPEQPNRRSRRRCEPRQQVVLPRYRQLDRVWYVRRLHLTPVVRVKGHRSIMLLSGLGNLVVTRRTLNESTFLGECVCLEPSGGGNLHKLVPSTAAVKTRCAVVLLPLSLSNMQSQFGLSGALWDVVLSAMKRTIRQ